MVKWYKSQTNPSTSTLGFKVYIQSRQAATFSLPLKKRNPLNDKSTVYTEGQNAARRSSISSKVGDHPFTWRTPLCSYKTRRSNRDKGACIWSFIVRGERFYSPVKRLSLQNLTSGGSVVHNGLGRTRFAEDKSWKSSGLSDSVGIFLK